MGTKNRIVYFYEPILKDKDGKAKPISSNFWQLLRKKIAGLEHTEFRFRHYGRDYKAWALELESPAVDYIYVGKRRPKQDWPDVEDADENFKQLSETGFERNLLEAAYLVEAGYKSVIAIARTSNGPTISAIEKMISDLLGTLNDGTEFELAPFVREDQLKRLAEAEGATKLHLRFDQNLAPNELPKDAVGRAIAEAKRIDPDGLATVELIYSFGNIIPDNGSSEELVRSIRNLVGENRKRGIAKASATLLKLTPEGKIDKEKVDFIRDRITVKGDFGGTDEEQPSTKMIVQGMLEASEKFREKL